MICSKCGNNIPDNSAFCISCGSPVTQSVMEQPVIQQPVMQQPMMQQPMMQQPMMQQPMMQQPMMQQPKKSKGPWIALGVSIAALIAIIVTIIVVLFACKSDDEKSTEKAGSSPKAVITAMFEALANENNKDFDKTLYPAILEMYKEYSPDLTYYDGILSDVYDTLEYYHDDTVKSFKVSNITIEETEEADEEDLDNANEVLSEYDGYKKMTYGATVYGTVTLTVGKEKYVLDFEFEIVKCGETYYILDFSDLD